MIIHASRIIIARAVTAIASVLFWWLTARKYSVDEIGVASALLSASSMIVLLAECGIGTVFSRILPTHKNPGRMIGSLFSVSFFVFGLGVTTFLIMCRSSINNLEFLIDPRWSTAFIFLAFFQYIFQLLDFFLLPYKKTNSVLVKNIIYCFLRVVLLPFFVAIGGFGIFAVHGLAGAFVLIFLLWVYRKVVLQHKISFCFNEVFKYLPLSGASHFNSLVQIFPGMLFPVILLSQFSEREAAFFYIPWMIFSIYLAFVTAIFAVLLVEASHKESIEPLLKKTSLYALVLVAAGIIVFGGFGNYILSFIKKDFSGYSFKILRYLFLSLVPCSINQLYFTILTFRKEIKKMMAINLFSLFVLCLSVTLFIIKSAALGVAQGWLIANSIVAFLILAKILSCYFLKKELSEEVL